MLESGELPLVSAVDRHQPEARALLERTVNVNSGTMNFAGVREVGRMFEREFQALGFTTEWIPGESFKRAGHLIARHRPSPAATTLGPKLLLIGHLDTVFEPDSPFQKFEAIGDTAARGPGVIDMKGGIVVMLLALRALADEGRLARMSVTVYLGGDEEKAGAPLAVARRALIAAADSADVAIGFEDGAGDPRTAVIARRGATSWVLRVKGRPSHSSQIFKPEVGDGAVFEAARILATFRDSLAGEEYLTFNPGLILGGTTISFDREQARGTAFGKSNVVAESTVVAGDVRALSVEQFERAKSRMRAIVARSRPGTEASIAFDDGYPPLAPTEGNRELLRHYVDASLDLELGPVEGVDPSRAGAADVSFTAGRVDGAIDGIGLRGTGGHTVQETADLRTIGSQAKRMALFLWRLPLRWRHPSYAN
ncbi:MAG: M20/M25/M40 family metallo-hydrolase [Candidatus Eiseniibacteriota bacterium]